MKKEQREELKRLATGATPGPWTFKRHTCSLSGEHTATDDWTVSGPKSESICFEGNNPTLADPEYLAAANPQAITELIAALEAAEKDADRYRFWRNRYPETFNPTDITPEDVDRLTDKAMEAK